MNEALFLRWHASSRNDLLSLCRRRSPVSGLETVVVVFKCMVERAVEKAMDQRPAQSIFKNLLNFFLTLALNIL